MPEGNGFEDRIRQAVSSGEFETANRLWEEFGQSYRERAAQGQATAEELASALELCRWSEVTVKCLRAHVERRFSESCAAASAAGAYRTVFQHVVTRRK